MNDLLSMMILLWKDNSFTMQERNTQALAIETYIMKLVIPLKETNQYCSRFQFKVWNVNTV